MPERKKKSEISVADSAAPKLTVYSGIANYYWTSSLFNEVYLQNDVPGRYSEKWENLEAEGFSSFCNGFLDLCIDLKDIDSSRWSEAETVNKWIKRVMALLGWHDKCRSANQDPYGEEISFTILENGKKKCLRPDLLYVDEPKEVNYIAKTDNAEKKLIEARQFVLVPLEAKYWNRLEEYRQGKPEAKGKIEVSKLDDLDSLDPDAQCIRYQQILNKDFGILTDGKTWRLLHRELSNDSVRRCYQFNLGALREHVENGVSDQGRRAIFFEAAKYFYHFFSKDALCSRNGEEVFVNEILQYSRKYVDKVEQDLKKRFIQAMNYACNGYKRSVEQAKGVVNKELVRSVAESQLFNILFIKYCEARHVLPIRAQDYKPLSLTKIIDAHDNGAYDPERDLSTNEKYLARTFQHDFKYENDGNELYDRLIRLTKIVHDGTRPQDDFGFEIAGFRESVFTDAEWKFVKTHKLTNQEMSDIIFQLGYAESDIRGKSYQQIPYNYFSPRQLGSIYESFLEFRLDTATEEMFFFKDQWLPKRKLKEGTNTNKLPHVKKGGLFFTPDNEERKATGSYYTPDYVVQYIVSRTLDPILEEASSKQLLQVQLCDPAMGSGHFLSAAVNYLAQKYLEARAKESDTKEGLIDAKRKVLSSCIYGVDINSRAVKLAKLSLWLETASIGQKLDSLDTQLRCADSVTDEFKWKKEFEKPFGNGGFDVVVGNPPYRKERESKELLAKIKESTYGELYYEGKMDLWYFFLHRAIDISRSGGLISFIVPTYWLKSTGSEKLIEHIKKDAVFVEAVDFWKNKIFEDVSGQHMVFVLKHTSKEAEVLFKKYVEKDLSAEEIATALTGEKSSSVITLSVPSANIYTEDSKIDFESEQYRDLLDHMKSDAFELEDSQKVFEVSQGIVEAPDRISKEMAEDNRKPELADKGVFVVHRDEIKGLDFNKEEEKFVRPYLRAQDVERFGFDYNKWYVFYIGNKENKLIKANKKAYPSIVKHLDKFDGLITSSNGPYGIHRTREERYFTGEKLLCPNMFDRPVFAYCEPEYYVNFAFNVVVRHKDYSLKYLLGILNSTLGAFWFDRNGKKRGVNNDVGVAVMRKFPVKRLSLSTESGKKRHEEIIELVDKISDLKSELKGNSSKKQALEKKIAELEGDLDSAVFKLYGFSKEQIARVKQAVEATAKTDEESEAA